MFDTCQDGSAQTIIDVRQYAISNNNIISDRKRPVNY